MKKQPWGILRFLLDLVLSPCFHLNPNRALQKQPGFALLSNIFTKHPASVAESNSMIAQGVILLVFWIFPTYFQINLQVLKSIKKKNKVLYNTEYFLLCSF